MGIMDFRILPLRALSYDGKPASLLTNGTCRTGAGSLYFVQAQTITPFVSVHLSRILP